jgi:hypothetical protein
MAVRLLTGATMEERELIKIVSDNPAHPKGYYTQFRDMMKPGDAEYFEAQTGQMEGEPGEAIQIDPGNPPAAPIKNRSKKR